MKKIIDRHDLNKIYLRYSFCGYKHSSCVKLTLVKIFFKRLYSFADKKMLTTFFFVIKSQLQSVPIQDDEQFSALSTLSIFTTNLSISYDCVTITIWNFPRGTWIALDDDFR